VKVTVLGTVVDTTALAKVVLASLIAGIGVTLAFALAILGATRFADMRRDDRMLEAGAFGALATIALAVCVAAVVLGIIVMMTK
jgi:hypothetical protein